MCVVDFSCSACFLLLYYVLVLIFSFSFSFILRFGGVFMRVYVARVPFLCIQCVFFAFLCFFVVFLGFFLCLSLLYWVLLQWVIVSTACGRFSCRLLCLCESLLICIFWDAAVFFSVFLCFSLLYLWFSVYIKGWQCLNRACFFSLWFSPESTVFNAVSVCCPSDCGSVESVYTCICVVDFSCFACFLLLYYILLLIFWLSFSFLLRFGGVFTRVYVATVPFLSTVHVFRVFLRLRRHSFVFSVL